MPATASQLDALRDQWLAAWPSALEAWSKYTRLRLPQLCLTRREAAAEGLDSSFAMIRLSDQSVVVSLPAVMESKVEPFALEILAHEIGHHVLAPANLTDHARCIARIRHGLPTIEAQAPMVANLYTDLLINDRLQRSANLRQAEVYRAMAEKSGAPSGAVWRLYMRIYEILWSLQRGTLGAPFSDDRLEGDAQLGARLVRSYARDWMEGAGRFAALLLPHLLEDKESAAQAARWHDTRQACQGGVPEGLSDMDDGEQSGAVHPAQDPRLNGEDDAADGETGHARAQPPDLPAHQQSRGQARQPYVYGEILRAAGVNLTDHDIAIRYYREQALPHLVPFPSRVEPESPEPLPEGLETWDFGEPIEALDVFQSLALSPRLVPGITTVQRVWGTERGRTPDRIPFDLDLYVDSSGSMPNPQVQISFLTLAGAIVALSALRVGARVQATLWSGKNQFTITDGFTRDEEAILRVLTGFYGGATQFPIHVLRDTYVKRPADARPAHILIISDDGVSTMFDNDERNNSGWDVAARSLASARGGGSMVLNMHPTWESQPGWQNGNLKIIRARDELGWLVACVNSWEGLVEFARAFSRKNYGGPPRLAKTS